jgi:hypothetical protein
VALIRYGTMRGNTGLTAIWPGTSQTQMAALSAGVLAAYAVIGMAFAVRSYRTTTIS